MNLRNDKHESVGAYEPHDAQDSRWVVAIKKGRGNARVVRFTKESDARKSFRKSCSVRVFYSPEGKEVASADGIRGPAKRFVG